MGKRLAFLNRNIEYCSFNMEIGEDKMINRNEIFTYVKETYNVEPDYPWVRTPDCAILRHRHNRKWFAAILDVEANKLGFDGNQVVDVLNVKCNPLLIGSLRCEPGILPAYHMNKEHWITLLLDGPVLHTKVYDLIDLSYQLTR